MKNLFGCIYIYTYIYYTYTYIYIYIHLHRYTIYILMCLPAYLHFHTLHQLILAKGGLFQISGCRVSVSARCAGFLRRYEPHSLDRLPHGVSGYYRKLHAMENDFQGNRKRGVNHGKSLSSQYVCNYYRLWSFWFAILMKASSSWSESDGSDFSREPVSPIPGHGLKSCRGHGHHVSEHSMVWMNLSFRSPSSCLGLNP